MPPFNKTSSRRDNGKQESGPVHVLKRMIMLINELIQVMDSEIALIEGRKIKEHAELLKRKQRLAIDYRASVKSLSLQPDMLKQVPEDVRKIAREAVQRLTEASERNAKILRGAITALQRLIQSAPASRTVGETLPGV